MSRYCLASLLVVGCGHPVIEVPYLDHTAPVLSHPKVLELAVDPSLQALGVPPLASVGLRAGYRELRLSRGHGMVLGTDYPVVRVVGQPDRVDGEVIRFRGISDTVAHTIRWSARRVRPSRPIDWARLLSYLDSLGVSDFEPPVYRDAIMDAGDLVVESRRGAEYRAYEVNAPQLRADTVSQRAAKIAAVVDSLERLTRGYE